MFVISNGGSSSFFLFFLSQDRPKQEFQFSFFHFSFAFVPLHHNFREKQRLESLKRGESREWKLIRNVLRYFFKKITSFHLTWNKSQKIILNIFTYSPLAPKHFININPPLKNPKKSIKNDPPIKFRSKCLRHLKAFNVLSITSTLPDSGEKKLICIGSTIEGSNKKRKVSRADLTNNNRRASGFGLSLKGMLQSPIMKHHQSAENCRSSFAL